MRVGGEGERGGGRSPEKSVFKPGLVLLYYCTEQKSRLTVVEIPYSM